MKTSNDHNFYRSRDEILITWSGKEVVILGANEDGQVDGTRPTIYGGQLASTESIFKCTSGASDQSHFVNLIFDGEDTCQSCFEQSVTGNHNSSFINCRFTQATTHGVEVVSSNYYSYYGCRFDNNGADGLNQLGSQFNIVEKCLFDNNAGDGADIVSGCRVTDCVFYNNGGKGLDSSISGSFFHNNIFDDNGSYGHALDGSGRATCTGNIYSNNTSEGIYTGDNKMVTFLNCAFFNNGGIGDAQGVHGESGYNDHRIFHNYIPGTSAENPNWRDTAIFDFTPGNTYEGRGAGMPSPIAYFGLTASDIGINRWKLSETISVF